MEFFIDLSKAFDTVSHEILLQKSFAYVLRGKIYDILNSYLTNRQQCVSVSKQQCVSVSKQRSLLKQ